MAFIEKTKVVTTTRRQLKVTGSKIDGGSTVTFAVGGVIVPVGAIVEVSMAEATNLIGRGVAVAANPEEVAAAGAQIVVAPSRNDAWRDAE